MLPNIRPSSGGNQPIFDDCLDLCCAVETQFLSPDTIVPPQKSSSGPEEEQQVLARLWVDSQEEEVQITASVTLLKLRLHLESEMKQTYQGEGGARASPPGYAVLGRTHKKKHRFLTSESVYVHARVYEGA